MSRPLGSTATPASSGFPATTGRSASERRIGTQCLRFPALARSLSRPGAIRPRVAVSALAFSRSVQEPQTRLTPPLRRAPPGQQRGHPPGSSREMHQNPRFRCRLKEFRRLNSARPPGEPPDQALLERLPGPHLTRSKPRLFPGRSPRQSSANAAPGRFDAYPRRADAGGPTILHLSHSSAYMRGPLHGSSFSVRDTRCGSSGVILVAV